MQQRQRQGNPNPNNIGKILKGVVQALIVALLLIWPLLFSWVVLGATFPAVREATGVLYSMWSWYIQNQAKLTTGVVVMFLITFGQLALSPSWSRPKPAREAIYGRGLPGYFRLMRYVLGQPSYWLKVILLVVIVGFADFGLVSVGAIIRDKWYDPLYPHALEAARIVAWYGSRFVMGFVTFLVASYLLPEAQGGMEDMQDLNHALLQEPQPNDWLRRLIDNLYRRLTWLENLVTSRWFFTTSTIAGVAILLIGQALVWFGLGAHAFKFGGDLPWWVNLWSGVQFLALWLIQATLLGFSDYVVGNVGAVLTHKKTSGHWPWQYGDWKSFTLTAFENGLTTFAVNIVASSLATFVQQAVFIGMFKMDVALSELYLVVLREMITDNWANFTTWRKFRLGRSSSHNNDR